jgi:hypothetical protein
MEKSIDPSHHSHPGRSCSRRGRRAPVPCRSRRATNRRDPQYGFGTAPVALKVGQTLVFKNDDFLQHTAQQRASSTSTSSKSKWLRGSGARSHNPSRVSLPPDNEDDAGRDSPSSSVRIRRMTRPRPMRSRRCLNSRRVGVVIEQDIVQRRFTASIRPIPIRGQRLLSPVRIDCRTRVEFVSW